ASSAGPTRGRGAKSGKSRPKASEEPPPPELVDIGYYADFSRFEEFCADAVRIVVKGAGKPIPLILNSTQRRVLAEIRRLRALGVPPRLLILKARQIGISTLVEALLFW